MSIIFSCFIISILLCSIHLFPSVEAYLYSARGNTDAKFIFDDYLVTFSHLITFIIPDFYGNPGTYNYFGKGFYYEKALFVGLAPFLFALYGLFHMEKKNTQKTFFSICFLIFLSLGISLPTTWFFLYYLKLPFLSTILPSRIFFLSTFCLAVISSYGIDLYLKKPEAKRISLSLVLMAIMLLGAWGFIIFQLFIYKEPLAISIHGNALVSFKNTILPTGIFIAIVSLLLWFWKMKNHRYIFFPAILIVTLFNFFYFANKYLYFSQKQYVFPRIPPISFLQKNAGIQRIWGYKNGHIENNFLTFYHLSSAEGYDSLYIKRYGELLFAGQNKGIVSAQIPRNDANFITNDYETGVDGNLYRGKLLSLLGIKYILEKNSDAITHKDDTHVKKVWDDGIFSIYEYTNAFPRVFLVNNIVVEKNDQEIINDLFHKNIDLRNTIILEEESQYRNINKSFKGSANILVYKPSTITVQTKSDIESFLFLSDNYYPGWEAFVDGKKTKIFRADYSFRSVLVPSGEHTIKFMYQPESLKRGIQGSLIGIVALIGLCMVFYRYNARRT